jgi:hypothetical protein
MFYFVGDTNSPLKHFCTTLNIVVLLTANCTLVTHTEGNGAFTLQQWLRDRATILPYRTSSYYKNKHNEGNKTSPPSHMKSAIYAQFDIDIDYDPQTICIRQYHLSAFLSTISFEVCRSLPGSGSFRTRP